MPFQLWTIPKQVSGFGTQELVVPARQLWTVPAVVTRIVTAPGGMNRTPVLEFIDKDGETVGRFFSNEQGAGLTRYHIFGAGSREESPGGGMGPPAGETSVSPMPPMHVVPTEIIRLTDANAIDLAGDEFLLRCSAVVRTF